MSDERRLLSTRRKVEASERAEYDLTWGELESLIRSIGNHAWRFAAAQDPASRIEFIEFKGSRDPRSDRAVADLLRRLDSISAGRTEEWVT